MTKRCHICCFGLNRHDLDLRTPSALGLITETAFDYELPQPATRLIEANLNAAFCYTLKVDHWKLTSLDFATYLAPVTE